MKIDKELLDNLFVQAEMSHSNMCNISYVDL